MPNDFNVGNAVKQLIWTGVFVHRLSLLRLNWFFPNPIQRIRGSTSHRQRRPPLRPAVSSLIWTAVSPNTNVRMSGIEVWSTHTDGQCEGFWDSFPQVVIQRRFILLSDVQKY